MRSTLSILLLLASFASYGQTLAQMKLKENMLVRTDKILTTLKDTQVHLKDGKYEDACDKIKEIYEIYPDHLEDIGGHMNILKGSVYKIRNESLQQLMFFHKQSLVCASGENNENIDPKFLAIELKKIEKSVVKQKKAIKKDSMEYDNTFHYEYEF